MDSKLELVRWRHRFEIQKWTDHCSGRTISIDFRSVGWPCWSAWSLFIFILHCCWLFTICLALVSDLSINVVGFLEHHYHFLLLLPPQKKMTNPRNSDTERWKKEKKKKGQLGFSARFIFGFISSCSSLQGMREKIGRNLRGFFAVMIDRSMTCVRNVRSRNWRYVAQKNVEVFYSKEKKTERQIRIDWFFLD